MGPDRGRLPLCSAAASRTQLLPGGTLAAWGVSGVFLGRAEPGRAGQGRVGQNRAGQGRAGQSRCVVSIPLGVAWLKKFICRNGLKQLRRDK